MKILNTVQQLWSYCLFCPTCQDITRTIHVSVGPDEAFKLQSFEKNNHILHLDCLFHAKNQKYKATYEINCLDNSFSCHIEEPISAKSSVNKASTPYFYFYIQGDCKECNDTYVSSKDLELDLLNKKIENIALEREGIYLRGKDSHYHLTMSYDEREMLITRCHDEDGLMIEDGGKPFHLPIIEFDFSKPKKVINKIKTILLFS